MPANRFKAQKCAHRLPALLTMAKSTPVEISGRMKTVKPVLVPLKESPACVETILWSVLEEPPSGLNLILACLSAFDVSSGL